MKGLLNFLCILIICLCPWINVLVIFSKALIDNNSKQIKQSLLFLISELFLFCTILAVTFQSGIFNYLALVLSVILFFSIIYSGYIFLKEKNNYGLPYFLISTAALFTSPFFILINLIFLLPACYEKKYKLIIFPLFNLLLSILLVADIIPGAFFVVICILNATNFILRFLIEKNNLLVKFAGSRLNKSTQNQKQPQSLHQQEEEINTSNTSTEIFHKGWITDDTEEMEINLLSIEDIINPIMLKNEHEKSIKELISYIRKLSNSSEDDSKKILGVNGLSGHLKIFFGKVNIEAVRVVYIKALYLLIEDYSRKDSKIKPFLEKLLIEQTNNYI